MDSPLSYLQRGRRTILVFREGRGLDGFAHVGVKLRKHGGEPYARLTTLLFKLLDLACDSGNVDSFLLWRDIWHIGFYTEAVAMRVPCLPQTPWYIEAVWEAAFVVRRT